MNNLDKDNRVRTRESNNSILHFWRADLEVTAGNYVGSKRIKILKKSNQIVIINTTTLTMRFYEASSSIKDGKHLH
jgi:hypothetical protein